ncbi:hypothetical protein [Paraburkholderia phenazinium]|uniref:hypothetical protein n=1 Tax=Paraburkholderia phenazinium TaxID=60549 RepID=UPI0015A1C6D8|nr:hypothetical protein [Paraburkholderia phenazinium]
MLLDAAAVGVDDSKKRHHPLSLRRRGLPQVAISLPLVSEMEAAIRLVMTAPASSLRK